MFNKKWKITSPFARIIELQISTHNPNEKIIIANMIAPDFYFLIKSYLIN